MWLPLPHCVWRRPPLLAVLPGGGPHTAHGLLRLSGAVPSTVSARISSLLLLFVPPSYIPFATRGHPVKKASHTASVDFCFDLPVLLVQLPAAPMRLDFSWIFSPLVPFAFSLLEAPQSRKSSVCCLEFRPMLAGCMPPCLFQCTSIWGLCIQVCCVKSFPRAGVK